MTTTNHQRVTEGLQTLTAVLAPYVARELRAEFADEWWPGGVFDVLYESQRRDLPAAGEDDALIARLDPARCLLLMDLHWNDLFRRKLSREHGTWVKELIATRNKWAHAGLVDMADEDAWRALDTMTRLIEQMDAEATESLRALARTVRYGTEGPSTSVDEVAAASRSSDAARRRGGGGSGGGAPAGVLAAVPRQGLRPWREVARPHPDVAAGRYRQAEFAADLSQVARGRAEAEYQDPIEFFARTYLTEGMRGLMVQALRRIAGRGGEPVIQFKTAARTAATGTTPARTSAAPSRSGPSSSPRTRWSGRSSGGCARRPGAGIGAASRACIRVRRRRPTCRTSRRCGSWSSPPARRTRTGTPAAPR